MNPKIVRSFILFFTFFLMPVYSVSSELIATKSDVGVLHLSLTDADWDGKTIPKGQQCREYDGNGASPRITIQNIPFQANMLILEFSDATYKPCDNGGHGVISYKIAQGSVEITVPSIPGQTFDLPNGFSLIQQHCGANLLMQPGAYIGPCPGIGNLYYVRVKALYESPDISEPELLGEGRVDIGTYQY